MKRETREKARELRRQGESINEIARQLGVSKGSASNWCKNIELTSEQIAKLKAQQHLWGAQNKGAQTNRINAYKVRQQYQDKGRKAAQNSSKLHLTGCMLYWAEGAKSRNHLQFANSDPYMLQLFIRFLREEFNIPEEKYHLQIHCHSEDTLEHKRIKQYWTNLLKLPLSSLQKIQIKKGSDTRKNRLENGICSLQVYNTQILHHIYGAIQEYAGFDNPNWLF